MAVNSETLATLRTHVRNELNEPSTAFIKTEEINMWLNQGMLKAIRKLETLEAIQSYTMTASTASYALPSDHQATIDVQYYDGSIYRDLGYITPSEYRGISTLTTSTPEFYTVIDNDLYFYPTPDSSTDTASLRYSATPNEIMDDTDVPYNDIARFYPFHLDLVDYALYRAFRKKGDFNSAQSFLMDFEKNTNEMVKNLSNRRKGGSIQMARSDSRITVGRVQLPPAYPYIGR